MWQNAHLPQTEHTEHRVSSHSFFTLSDIPETKGALPMLARLVNLLKSLSVPAPTLAGAATVRSGW